MNNIAIILIIIFVLGIIASNIALIRYSNKFQLPPKKDDDSSTNDDEKN
ncbi:MAG: DUF2897 family protein [Gammaproteobacteria bacterium]|nr:DUF2897 family protein [Gammaproteobacteria bacterium]